MESVDSGSDSGGVNTPVARGNTGTLQHVGVIGGGVKKPLGMSRSEKKGDKTKGAVSRPVFLHTSQKEAGRFATAHGADVVYMDTFEINPHVFGQVLRTLLENCCLSKLWKLIKSGELERVVVLWPRENEVSIYADALSGLKPKVSLVRGCRPTLKGVDASERRKVIPVEYVKAPTHFVVHDVYDVGPAELYRTCVQCAGVPTRGSSHKVTMMIYDFGTPGDFEQEDEDSMFIHKYRAPKTAEDDESFVVEAVAVKRIRNVWGEWKTTIDHHSRPGTIYEASDNSYPSHGWFKEYLYYSIYYGYDEDAGWFRMTSHVGTSKGPKVLINLAFEPVFGLGGGDDFGRRRPEWEDVRSNRVHPTPFHRNWVNGPVLSLAREAAMDIPSSLKSYVYSTFTNKVRQNMEFRYDVEKSVLDKFLMPPIAPGVPGLSVWSEVLTKTVGYGLSHPLKLFEGAPPGVSGYALLAEKAAAARIKSVVPMPDGLAEALSHSADKQTWFDAGLLALRIIKELGKAAWDGLKRVFDFLVQCLPNVKVSGLSFVSNVSKAWNKTKSFPGIAKGWVNKAVKFVSGPVTRSVKYRDFVEWLQAHPVVDAVLGCVQTALAQLVEAAAEEIVKRVLPLRIFALILAVAEALVSALDADTNELKVFFFNLVWRSVAHVLLALMPFPVAVCVHFLFNMARYVRDVWRGQERMHLSASLDEFLISESGPLNEIEMEALDVDFEILDSDIVTPPVTTLFGEEVESSLVLSERPPTPCGHGGSVAIVSSNCTDAFGKPVNDLRTFLGIVQDRFNVDPPEEIEEAVVRDYVLFERMMGDKMRPVSPFSLEELREYVDSMPFSTGKKEMYYERIAKLQAGGPIIVGLVQMGIKTDEKLPFKSLPSGLWMKCRPLFPMDEVGLWAMCWILAFKKQFDHPFVWEAPWGQFSMHYSVSPTQKNLNSWFSTFRFVKGVHIIIHGDDNFIIFSNGMNVWVAAYDLKSCDLTCGPVHQSVHRDFFRRYGMSEQGVEGMRERANAVRAFEEWVEGVRVQHKFRMRPCTDTGRPTTSFDAALMQMPMWCRLFNIIKDSQRQVGSEFAKLVCEMFTNLATRHGVMVEWEEDIARCKVGPLSTRSFLGGIFVETTEGVVWSPLTGVKGACFVRDPRDVYPTKDLKEALWIALKATVSDQVARINPVTELICAHYTRWMEILPRPEEAVLQKALKAYRHNMNAYDLSRLEEDDVVKVDMDSFVLALSQYNSCRGFPDPWESLCKLYEAFDTANDVFVRVETDMSPLWFNARWGKLKMGPWVREERRPLFGALNLRRLFSGSNKQKFDIEDKNFTIGFAGERKLNTHMKSTKTTAVHADAAQKKKSQKPSLKNVNAATRGELAKLRSNELKKTSTSLYSGGTSLAMVATPTKIAKKESVPVPSKSNLASKLEAANRQEKVALGDPNKVGRAINSLNGVKNLKTKDVGALKNSKAIDKIMSCCDPKKCLSPDAQRYAALLDKPFDAPWGDEGEMPVRPLVYEETVPPTATAVCRQFGQTTVTIPAGRRCDILAAVGAGNQQGTFYPSVGSISQPDGDATGVAQVNVFTVGGANNFLACTTLGAPADGSGISAASVQAGEALGRGSFGFFQLTGIGSSAPSINTTQVNATILQWGSPAPFGDMSKADSGNYKYRPIAGGLMITPVDAELSVGGSYDCEVIPSAINDPFMDSVTGAFAASSDIADLWALPDHKIVRGDNHFQVNWLPSRLDYGFKRTQGVCMQLVGAQASVAFYNENVTNGVGHSPTNAVPALSTDPDIAQITDARNVRMVATITPPQDGNSHSYVLSYVGFYEVAGSCVQQIAIVPRPQPTLGAKVATAVQNDLQQEVDDRRAQVSKGAAFEVMKDHPTIGPMIEKSKDASSAKSTLSEILDFGKMILPIAEALIL